MYADNDQPHQITSIILFCFGIVVRRSQEVCPVNAQPYTRPRSTRQLTTADPVFVSSPYDHTFINSLDEDAKTKVAQDMVFSMAFAVEVKNEK